MKPPFRRSPSSPPDDFWMPSRPGPLRDPAMRGVYRVEYSTPATGTYLMHITYDGAPIANSPFTVTVTKDAGSVRAAPPPAAAAAWP